jgi:RecA-family ATPase
MFMNEYIPSSLQESVECVPRRASAASSIATATLTTPGLVQAVYNEINLAELVEGPLPEPRWIIQDLVPEGITVLAGKPKTGKTWLLLQLALAVANGHATFGQWQAKRGGVLYIGPDDTHHSMYYRVYRLLQGRAAPHNFAWYNQWLPLQQGGLADLEELLDHCPSVRVVVIDPLMGVLQGVSVSRAHTILTPLKIIAHQYHVAIMLSHHLAKHSAGEPMMHALNAALEEATDCMHLLKRVSGESTGQLYVSGRAIFPQMLALNFDASNGGWSVR